MKESPLWSLLNINNLFSLNSNLSKFYVSCLHFNSFFRKTCQQRASVRRGNEFCIECKYWWTRTISVPKPNGALHCSSSHALIALVERVITMCCSTFFVLLGSLTEETGIQTEEWVEGMQPNIMPVWINNMISVKKTPAQ